MSWMVPRFIEQSGPPVSNAEDQLGHYRLYLYREDGWDLSDRVGHTQSSCLFADATTFSLLAIL